MRLQEHYGKYVTGGGDGPTVLKDRAADLGYQTDWLPSDILENPALFQASCGSGCPLRLPDGMPTKKDSIILDFGCGAGHDVLLACHFMTRTTTTTNDNDDNQSNKKVIGVDLTPEMIAAARENVKQYPKLAAHIEFVEANLEEKEDDSSSNLSKRLENKVDLIISNGVLNLCRNKQNAFQTLYKLLKPGGRLVFSDVMKLKPEDVDKNATIATSINGDVFSS